MRVGSATPWGWGIRDAMSVELEDNEDTHADWLGGIFGAREEIKLPARCKEVL